MEIPKHIRPLIPGYIVDDALFQGTHDLNLYRQSAAYALRACGNYAHFTWHDRWSAPRTAIAARNTWYDFTHYGVTNTTLDVPWHHQVSFYGIRMLLRLITDSSSALFARITTDDLVDVVAESNSTGVKAAPTELSTFLNWNSKSQDQIFTNRFHDGDMWRVAVFDLLLASPTMPANRRVAVRPQVYQSAGADILVGFAQDPQVYVETMSIMDVVDPDTEG